MTHRSFAIQQRVLVLMLALLMAPFTVSAQGNSDAAHACQGDGYMWLAGTDGETFRNVGQCVSYAARGGTFAAGAIVVPAGYSVTFSDQVLAGCNALTFGYTLSSGVSEVLGTKATTGCHGADTYRFDGTTLGPFTESAVLVIFLNDDDCRASYRSDSFHGRVEGSTPQFFVDIADAGPNCTLGGSVWNGPGEGNLSLTVTIHP